ncbi:dihydrodipicolinate reductase [Candidatus Bathyarchaeota archaeon]|nr:dihydrodipicolinate reductase [Candidatus Bathyarchaeota archaeon]
MKKQISVVQFGLGPIGCGIAKLVLQKRNLRLVGAIDIDPDKAGKDIGRLLKLDKDIGVIVERDASKVLSGNSADIVLHSTSSLVASVKNQILSCIEAGSNVISTTEELVYPFSRSPELSKLIDDKAKARSVSVLGTGVNPGFVMDTLPIFLSTVCHKVESVEVTRILDASTRRLPLQRKIGAGITVEQFKNDVEDGKLGHVGLLESIAMLSDGLGLGVDRSEQIVEPVVADRDLETQYLTVKKGEVAGIRNIGRGYRGQSLVVLLHLEMYVGAKNPKDKVTIKGNPNMEFVVEGGTPGDPATVAMIVNAIPKVIEAKPGLISMIDLRLPSILTAV